MSAIYEIQASFGRGEVSPLLASRIDADFWPMALARCENFTVMVHGGLRRRSGTVFVAEIADSEQASRLFPFLFSNDEAYVLDVNGDSSVRFYAQRGVLGAPYEVTHSWDAGDIAALSYTQFNDVAYFAHAGYAPQKLSRLGDTSWTLSGALFKDGPYLGEDTSGTTLTPADTGAVVPDMTSLTAPSGTAAGTGPAADAWEAFDRNTASSASIAATNGFISYEFAASGTRVADAYWIVADNTAPQNTPTSWVFEGYTGSVWIVLDTRIGETGWFGGERRYYDFPNLVAYRAYRLSWTAVDGGSATAIAELVIHQAGDSQPPFNLTASSTTGVNAGTGFQASDVGRTIHLLGSDGVWRWARIAAVSSSTVVTIRLYGHALLDTAPIGRWQLGAFSAQSGFPALTTLYNQRLFWGRTDSQPVTVWGSKSTDLEDYGFSSPILETDAVDITLLSANMNELNWLGADEDLITGSAKQIRSIGPNDITQGFSALNVSQKKGPNSGAAPIPPLSIGGTTLYVSAGARKIRELVLGDQNRYVAPELSLLGEQNFASGISDWAFSENPDPTVYVVTNAGELVAMLYDREQRAIGFSRYVFAGGTVESAAVIPSDLEGYDDVYLVVLRTINGVQKRYVEVLERPFDYANDSVEDGFFLDCGLTYSGSPTTVIANLDHLEGEAVSVLADGGVVAGLTVSGGSITLPYPASRVHVGLAYESHARTLPVAGPGQDGVLFGRRVNNTAVHVDLLATGALQVGAYGGPAWSPPAYESNPHLGDAQAGQPVELTTGVMRCDIEGSWASGGGAVVLKTSQPLPALIRSVILTAEREP